MILTSQGTPQFQGEDCVQDLFEFRVMPFGLWNTPAVFQQLMQKLLAGLNPENGTDFVSVYIDDILVFSDTGQTL